MSSSVSKTTQLKLVPVTSPDPIPNSDRTQGVARSVFEGLPTASPLARAFAFITGRDRKAEEGLMNAIGKLPQDEKGDNEPKKQEIEPLAGSVTDALTSLPVSCLLSENVLDEVPSAVEPPAASQRAIILARSQKYQPPSMVSSRKDAVARAKKVQDQVFGPSPSLAFQALSFFKASTMGPGETNKDLLERVIDGFNKRKKLILREAGKLNEQHPQYNLIQIIALYEEDIISSFDVRQQSEEIHQNYTLLMERAKTVAERNSADPAFYVQAARQALLKNLESLQRKEEFEAVLVTVKAQHYFALQEKNAPFTGLENFADHFEEDVEEALKRRIGSTSSPEQYSGWKKKVESEFLKAVALDLRALESVAKYQRPPLGFLRPIAKEASAYFNEQAQVLIRRKTEITNEQLQKIRYRGISLNHFTTVVQMEIQRVKALSKATSETAENSHIIICKGEEFEKQFESALIQHRQDIIQRLEDIIGKSPYFEREQAARFESITTEEKEAIIRQTGLHDSSAVLNTQLEHFKT